MDQIHRYLIQRIFHLKNQIIRRKIKNNNVNIVQQCDMVYIVMKTNSEKNLCLFLESLEFSILTSKILWSQLTNEAKARYNFDLNW
jgi:hypothetical protein